MNTKLPETFMVEMKSLLGGEYEQYRKSFDAPRSFGLRVNTLKWSAKACAQKLPCKTEQIPWIDGGLFYEEDEVRLSKEPYYYGGLYYLQEPSAMTPAFLLPVEPGDMVLDLCAAPGGKSTQLGEKLKGEGMLLSNDISNSRAKALLKNLELFGISNMCVTSEGPEKLAQAFPQFFDKILVDAPCSGEGMFRKEPQMIKDWLEKGPDYYCRIQKDILGEAVKMLKPGGYLMYSTCTFSVKEDEDVIRWALEAWPDMELEPLPHFEGASGGVGLTGCIRLFPHKIRGEGHFMALLHKKEAGQRLPLGFGEPSERGWNVSKGLEKEEELWDFLKRCRVEWDYSRLVRHQDTVYYLPQGFQEGKKLRYLRTGLWIGTLKKGRFQPSQAMAMTLSGNLYDNSISFDREDSRVIRYLKGETIALKEGEGPLRGWCLVCVDGFALGFAKGNHMALKNKYYPGWRWQ